MKIKTRSLTKEPRENASREEWGSIALVEHLPRVCEVLGPITSNTHANSSRQSELEKLNIHESVLIQITIQPIN